MMIKLIGSELKKIFKIKMNIVLLIIAIGGTVGFVGLKYYEYINTYDLREMQNQSGEHLSRIGNLRYIDDIRHQYAGEWSESKAKQMLEDYNQLIKKYQSTEIDKMMMAKAYGENYEDILQPMLNEELTYKQYHDYRIKYGEEDLHYEPKMANEIINLQVYAKDDPISQGIKLAYGNLYQDKENVSSGLKPIIDDLTKVLLNKNYSYTKEQLNEDLKFYSDEMTKEKMGIIVDYLNNKLSLVPSTYDSGVSNSILVNSALNNCMWIPILCIMIILANTFGMEKQYQVDQVIYPTKATFLKITISKIIAGTFLSLSTMILTIGLSYLVGHMILPIHTWDMFVFSFAQLIPSNMLHTTMFVWSDVMKTAILLCVMASLAISTITLGLSYFIKNRFAVIVILFVYMGLGIFLNTQNMTLYTHPFIMTQVGYYDGLRSLAIIGNNVIPYSTIAIIFWIIVMFFVLISIIIHSRTRRARNV